MRWNSRATSGYEQPGVAFRKNSKAERPSTRAEGVLFTPEQREHGRRGTKIGGVTMGRNKEEQQPYIQVMDILMYTRQMKTELEELKGISEDFTTAISSVFELVQGLEKITVQHILQGHKLVASSSADFSLKNKE
jgi:hypothetical protein